ncbi:outer membrane protein assembly factor BamA [Ulvibacter sp. MAR_2010_11]|uniref:metallophosphoesterase n=1 Tax=Ulvibacter sp. MAR_2010_11 TaxID=1250229 RepID=UPI000C2C1347|nr:metallophosphoesterase [Ulvibacter sp. MAR_2010_11]PKA84372.1 outer membrane protein assembly factor BamA [Ulvibacter sp. MAR_2010_11]
MHKKRIYALLFSIFLYSCASVDTQYFERGLITIKPSDREVEKTFYLVGDAGYSEIGGMSDGLKALQNYLKTENTVGNYALFLGDNIYPSGMPPEGHPDRIASEYRLDAQYNAVKDYDGQVFFIPGNHDWYSEGLIGLKREEQYFELKLKDRQVFQPTNGCPLKSISVTDNIQLIMIDTQWYLENWDVHPTINESCEIKSREKLFIEIETELEKHQNKTIVFAMHHPMFTNGTHGGYFNARKHLYPTQGNWPLPFLSSLVVQIRSQGGVSIQDRYNELYNNLMNELAAVAKNSDRLVFVSGHEHNLQYIERDGFKQVVSGSGSKGGGVSLGKDGLFATGSQGFAVLHVYKDGSSWIHYYGVGENYSPKLLYEKEIFSPIEHYNTTGLTTEFPQTTIAPIYKRDSLSESLFLKSVWGARYKEAYSTPVTSNVALLDTLYGGLEVIREGGQKEYRSLRLRDKKGNEYRMRALGKNSLDFSQKIVLDKTLEEAGSKIKTDIVAQPVFDIDFYTASHPYAPLAIPKMAAAVNIFYTNSQLFYVPKQKRLGNYNDTYGDELYLIAIDPTEQSEGEQTFMYPDDIETTDDILIKIRKGGDVFVDEENYITSRLFDMLIGDWDREPDHWRWAEYYNSYGKNVYVPIPRNRDDAFSSFDAKILDLGSSIFSGTRQRHVYNEDLSDLQWFNEEGIILDRALLERSGRSEWVAAAKLIQEKLTPEVIEDAFNSIPEAVRDTELQTIKEKLVARKEKLADIADRYYSLLANLQTVVGTDMDDYIEITRLADGNTSVRTFSLAEGSKGTLLTQRTYNHSETRELWIYGLAGNDVIEVNGTDDDLIYVRVIGGQGNDIFKINEGRRVKVYDYESKPSTVEINNKGSLIFSDLYELNTYDYRKQIDDDKRVGPAFGYNPDDGFRLGVQLIYTINSFKRNPFSKRHALTAGYYFDTSSFDLDYSGEFANSIGDLNLSIGARITSPNYVVNYFGYGNETGNPQNELGYEYNRLGLQTISANIGLLRNSSFGSFFKVQTKFDAITVNSSQNNLFQDFGKVIIDETNYFGTLEGVYSYRSFDNPLSPSRGMIFDLKLGVTDNLSDFSRVFGYLKSNISFYNALIKNEKLVLKTTVNSAFNFGNSFEFYQSVHAGANTGLRGYRERRFSGKSALVGSADIRYAFDEFRIELFPIQIGLYAGADLGKVWVPNQDSEKWHNSFGGGLWMNGQGGLGGTFSAFNSIEGMRYSFGLGFTF